MLDATEAMILELGTRKTTLKDVGERAGYSRGLAQARYGDKETLFLKLAERCRGTWIGELQRAGAGQRGLAAFLSRIDAMASFAESHPDEARVLYILWFESVGFPSSMKEGLGRFHQQARQDIRGLIVEAQAAGEIALDLDPDHFAIHFTSTLFGMCYQWLVNPDAFDLQQVMSDLKRQMLLILRPIS